MPTCVHSVRTWCWITPLLATCFDLSVGARAHSSLLWVIQFLLLQRYALFSDIPSIEPVKLRAVKINTSLLMQSDISFILHLHLPIVACTCDVSTLANITGSLIESQCLSRKKSSLLHKGAKQRIRYSLPGCRSSQHVLLSLSVLVVCLSVTT